ncbi:MULTISPECIES: tRNA pseudouridine(55) synthase TruB [Oceanobacillus]|uniref:tRNA pseudouridine synthase B n=1 Tax=Oceanobacillus kimchii TaxID=746691 RepID=A0ABQ5TGP8_9BACI|nr:MULTISPECIES: tRNA pseudouridine(55) synthase TruB [Oceanobacillus]MBT2598666.1 tRNA pseudouridine(55) synthase TruB [Oceanobacillus sp. ISL-74]MBT2651585.1 tRNA pseudouridine(55) synthase TruB [Oceanobacillus sp. ISL-73]GLO66038.1 tRNA pseudouridine(55) synthase TruB [Oceanobacillus kimchii]
MNGILPLWKPKGLTSHDCVIRCRRYFKTKKVGHTGTLDPEVEGVLPICIGQATKIVPFLTDTKKVYEATVQLGSSTETEDATGKIVETKEVSDFPTIEKLHEVLQTFLGRTKQIPPIYSAVKVNGKKLYEYARANETVKRPVREIEIFELTLTSVNEKNHSFDIRIVCSKGTYIRTLCVDIGKALGYPAHMSLLVRTNTGTFSEKNTITFDMIEEAVSNQSEERLLVPIINGLQHLDQIEVNEDMKKRILNGQKLSLQRNHHEHTDPFVFVHRGNVLAIYQSHPTNEDQIKPVRVFAIEDKKV